MWLSFYARIDACMHAVESVYRDGVVAETLTPASREGVYGLLRYSGGGDSHGNERPRNFV